MASSSSSSLFFASFCLRQVSFSLRRVLLRVAGAQAVDLLTSFGVLWDGECRLPVQWNCKMAASILRLQSRCLVSSSSRHFLHGPGSAEEAEEKKKKPLDEDMLMDLKFSSFSSCKDDE